MTVEENVDTLTDLLEVYKRDRLDEVERKHLLLLIDEVKRDLEV